MSVGAGTPSAGPVPMGTAVIANSLFLCFLAMLPLLEYWQALGRSDMQKRCQVGLVRKECFPSNFLLCVVTSTLSYLGKRLQWGSAFSTHRRAKLIKRRLCELAPCHKLTGWTCSWGFTILRWITGSVLVKWLQVSVTASARSADRHLALVLTFSCLRGDSALHKQENKLFKISPSHKTSNDNITPRFGWLHLHMCNRKPPRPLPKKQASGKAKRRTQTHLHWPWIRGWSCEQELRRSTNESKVEFKHWSHSFKGADLQLWWKQKYAPVALWKLQKD